MASDELLHLTGGSAAADVIRETLRRLGRDDLVIGMHDALMIGPLQDVDSGAASRIDWWNRIRREPLDAAEARKFDDSELWDQVRGATPAVLLWHGPHPVDRIFALRACWQLRHQPNRIHEVVLPERSSQFLPAFHGAVAIVGPDVTTREWQRRAKVPDVAERAKRWEQLRDRPGDWIRVLDGENIVELPVTAHDAELVKACADGEWTLSLRIVGRVLADHPTTDSLLMWRVRELLRAGTLEGRGDENRIGLPTEVRPLGGRPLRE